MAKRWVISDGTVAREIVLAKVSVNGEVKPIKKACVVENGVVRHFWPPAAASEDPPE